MSVPFYKLIAFGENEYGFWNEPMICMKLETAYHYGEIAAQKEDTYGYVILEVNHEDWRIINQTVYGCDIEVYCTPQGNIKVKKK